MSDTYDFAEHRKPWDRMPGESDKAYRAFECYLDMPMRPRGLNFSDLERWIPWAFIMVYCIYIGTIVVLISLSVFRSIASFI